MDGAKERVLDDGTEAQDVFGDLSPLKEPPTKKQRLSKIPLSNALESFDQSQEPDKFVFEMPHVDESEGTTEWNDVLMSSEQTKASEDQASQDEAEEDVAAGEPEDDKGDAETPPGDEEALPEGEEDDAGEIPEAVAHHDVDELVPNQKYRHINDI